MTSDGGAPTPGGQKGYTWSFNTHSEGLLGGERVGRYLRTPTPTLGKVMSTLVLHKLS